MISLKWPTGDMAVSEITPNTLVHITHKACVLFHPAAVRVHTSLALPAYTGNEGHVPAETLASRESNGILDNAGME